VPHVGHSTAELLAVKLFKVVELVVRGSAGRTKVLDLAQETLDLGLIGDVAVVGHRRHRLDRAGLDGRGGLDRRLIRLCLGRDADRSTEQALDAAKEAARGMIMGGKDGCDPSRVRASQRGAPVHVLDGEAGPDERHIEQRLNRVSELARLAVILVSLGDFLEQALDQRRVGVDLRG
jgi:hypothetical protein